MCHVLRDRCQVVLGRHSPSEEELPLPEQPGRSSMELMACAQICS